MAEHYVSEQEQVEQLKRWWKDNGKALIAGLVHTLRKAVRARVGPR